MSRHTAGTAGSGRLVRSALALALALAAAPVAAADVSHLTVRFREAAQGASAPGDVARLQALAALARTGFGAVEITRDGAYRVALAPALTEAGAREALARLRMDADVLYAEPTQAGPAVLPKEAGRSGRTPPPTWQIVVKYRDPQTAADAQRGQGLSSARMGAIAARIGLPVAYIRGIGWAGAHIVALPRPLPQAEVEALAAAIAQDPEVEWAEADARSTIQLVPNDTRYLDQWHYFAPAAAAGGANLPAAWDITTGWAGVRSAVIDTGALFNHPDLAGRFIGGYDMVSNWADANDNSVAQPPGCMPNGAGCVSSRDDDAADPGDWVTSAESAGTTFGGWYQGCPVDGSSWHGSHVAGTIGANTNNAEGVAGINWVSRIVPVRTLGKCGGFNTDISDGLIWAAGGNVLSSPTPPSPVVPLSAFPAKVLNLSLGGGGACGTLYQNAINGALALGATVVVAAGNENSNASGFQPASCNGIITVGALGRNGQRASYSNFGSLLTLSAPGGGDGQPVLSTLNAGTTVPLAGAGMNYVGYNGTSMATPHVAGIATLLLSLKPTLTPAQVKTVLQSTVRPFPTGTIRDCTTALCGAGIVDAAAALALVRDTGGFGGTALAASTTALGALPSPSAQNANVQLTASVTGSSPTGTVTFTNGDYPIFGCVDVALTGGGNTRTAVCNTTALPLGVNSLRAVYSGNFASSPSNRASHSPVLVHTVSPPASQPTTTALTSNVNPQSQGLPVTLSAAVTGASPTGTVNFRNGGVTIAGCGAATVTGAGNTRSAQCVTSALPPGLNALDAQYTGDAGNQPSSGTLSQGIVATGVCSRFNDVPGASAFCSDVQWINNRGITQGCTLVDYCPSAAVIRLAMAAFMAREGTALTPFDVQRVTQTATLSLATPQVACFDNGRLYDVAGFPRRARVHASAELSGPSASTAVTVEPVYSTNGGTTWFAIANGASQQSLYTGQTPPDRKTVVARGTQDLLVGNSYLFGLRFTASPAVTSLTIDCRVEARIASRTGPSAPF